jgi:cobalt-zinc-cadmium resistance protein CzcA
MSDTPDYAESQTIEDRFMKRLCRVVLSVWLVLAVGGVLALWLRYVPFRVSAGIGFVALSGVAILNGLVLVTFIQQKIEAGRSLEQAVREGCLSR